MARKPRMGRNLNALLNSAVKERREQTEEARSPLAERGAAEASARAEGEETLVRNASAGGGDVRDADEEVARASPASAGADLAVVRASAAGVERGLDDLDHAPGGRGRETSSERSGDGSDDRSPAARHPDRSAAPSAGGSAVDAASRASRDDEPGVTRVAAPVPTARATPAREEEGDPADPPRPGDRLRLIGVERIRRGVFQPRRFFDQEALQELADSLTAQGMIQPVVVRPIGDVFELIAGERRWRAAQIAGLAEIPAIVREMEDRSVAAVSLIENIQREDLNPLEEAQALMRLCDEFGMTHASVAESIGRSRAAVSNLMRLLELHDDVKAMVDKGELDMGHARALLRVPTVDQPALAIRVAKQGLTVRAVEKLIRTGADKAETDDAGKAAPTLDPDVERLVERLSGVLGAPVSIRHKPGGSGRLEIRYGSLDELDGILSHIR